MVDSSLMSRVKAARRHGAQFQPDKKLTQAGLGKLVGVTQQAIQKLETGGALESTALPRIARECRVSVEWLTDGIGDMLPSQPVRAARPSIADRRDELGLSSADIHARMLAYQWPDGVEPPTLSTVGAWFEGKERPLDMVYRGMLYKALEMALDQDQRGLEMSATTEVEADLLRMSRLADPDEAAQVLLLWKQIRQAKGAT